MWSALLVAVYAAAFFPMSALPGAAAQFFSIIPIVVIASWLGAKGGLIIAAGFIPLLAVLSVLAQGVGWTYLAFEGRPAALISLMTMAAVAGRASDLRRKLIVQVKLSDSYTAKSEMLARDRERLVKLGISLADAHSTPDVYRVATSAVAEWLQADRISFVEIDENASEIEIKHVVGVEVPGFEVGNVFEINDAWQENIDADRSGSQKPRHTLPTEKLELWRDAGFRSVLRIPLKTRDSVTGYIALCSYNENAYDESAEDLITAAAQQIAPHLRAAWLFDGSNREAQLRRAQSEVARALSMSSGISTMFDVTGTQIEALLNCDLGLVAETQQGGNDLVVKKVFGQRAAAMEEGTSFEWDPDLTYLDDEVRYWDLETIEIGEGAYPFSLFASEGFKAVAMITLMTEGEPIGWMAIASSRRLPEPEYTSQLLQSTGVHLANVIIRSRVEAEQKRLLDKLESQNNQLRAARTHLQETQQEVEQQNKELQRANEAKNTFLSAVSHELKTPLAIMVGFAELLGMNIDGNLSDQQMEQLRMVERNGRHLDLLVSDLVDVSRIESGRLAVNLESTDPEEILNETLAGLDAIASEKEQVLIRDFDLQGTLVRADRARLSQVVTNLVTNACKYSPAESEVVISSRIEENELVVVVADQGLGITKEDQEKLFTPFFRSSNEEAQKEKGTGLGLVITRSIVEMHGGTLVLESDLGQGTTITVRMPGVITEDDQGVPPADSDSNSGASSGKSEDAA